MLFDQKFWLYTVLLVFGMLGCQQQDIPVENEQINLISSVEEEKAAILATINEETKAAFSRDYEGWKDKWIQEDYVTKTYINFADNTATETLGWKDINEFVKNYIESHPEPDPIPELVNDIQVRLFGNAAWVSYEQDDANRGRKRETRLMEKVAEKWKIAGMHTTIYGFETK